MKSKEMKKCIKRLISCMVFSALVWIVFVHCTYLFRSTGRQILAFYLEEPDSLDVVFVGPSSVYNYWNPMVAWHEYGFTSYSYSVPGLTGDAALHCVKDICKKQNPVVVVVDVRRYLSRFSPNDINEVGYINLFDSMDFDLERLATVNYMSKLHNISVKDAIIAFIDLISYHNNKSVLANKSNWILWNNRMREPPYGLYKGSQIGSSSFHQFHQKPEVITDEGSSLNECDERALRDLLGYCQKNNIQIMLTASPYIYIYQDVKEFNMIAKIADEYKTPFLNVNQYLNETDLDFSTDFWNTNHTNLFGMEKYTCYMAEKLKEYYAIPTQHEDTLVAAWDNLYLQYEQNAKNIKNQILTSISEKTQAIADENVMFMTSDAGEWLSLANNDNMTVFVLMDQNSEYTPSLVNEQLLKTYGLTAFVLEEEDHYFCVYSGKMLSSSTSKSSLSGECGSRIESKMKYSMSIEEQSQIVVGERNYIEGAEKGIHMVVFDNNTYDFVDSVNLTISSDGELHLEHNSSE